MNAHLPAPTLIGKHVRLEPLGLEHVAGIYEAGKDEDIWRHTRWAGMDSEEDALRYIQGALKLRDEVGDVPFAIVDLASGAVAGSTRYLDVRPEHGGLEIGWTWVAPRFQRTAINTECKYLLLGYAFETLGMERVQLKTDILNEKSQRAIERIGGVREGVLRKHQRRRDGTLRDTVMYSIVREEWPGVKARLEGMLGKDEA